MIPSILREHPDKWWYQFPGKYILPDTSQESLFEWVRFENLNHLTVNVSEAPLHHFSLNISIKASNSGSWRSKSPSFFCICSICWLIHAINCEGCYTWGSTRNKEHWNIEHLTCVSDKRLPDHREGLEGRIHRLTHNTAGIPSTEVNLKDLTPNSTNT